MVTLLVLSGIILTLFAAHPFITYPLSLRFFKPVEKSVADLMTGPYRPKVAICMSAYKEVSVIEAKMERLLAMAAHYGNASIHVYADAPDDGTSDILRRYADRVDLIISTERTGKTVGMNLLVERTQSDLLLFTDANVVHDAEILEDFIRPLTDLKVGCVSARLVYSNSDESAAAATGAAYWSMEEWIKGIESDSIGLIGVDGAMFALRRSLYVAPPPYLIDDLYLSLIVLISGQKLVSVADVTVYERSATAPEEEFQRKRRIACQAINVNRALWPQLWRMGGSRLYGYVSHRIIKWLTPFLLSGAAACFLGAIGLYFGGGVAAILALIGTAILLVGLLTGIQPFSTIWAAVISLAGVALGVIDSVFGKKTYTVWQPAASVRDEPLS
jgi:cellulose synthase/poly-beta-1,6-N-acetylglucosamine synthase-like glycosyltransferase